MVSLYKPIIQPSSKQIEAINYILRCKIIISPPKYS